MSRRKKKRNRTEKPSLPVVGGSPGALLYLGRRKIEKPAIRITSYDAETLIEKFPSSITEVRDLFDDASKVTWMDFAGLQNVTAIEEVGQFFDVHPLVLEDILHPRQRPKVEIHKGFVFVVLRTLVHPDESHDDQISILFGRNFVLSFQEREEDLFQPVRNRIRAGRPRIRGNASDYLTYALVDTIVDGYFVVLEALSDQIDEIGDQLLSDTQAADLHDIYELKRTLGAMRHSIWPIREVVNRLTRDETDLIQEPTAIYLRDVYDHTIRAIETVESLRDLTAGLHDLYLSVVSHRMNEVMKVLTIIATIFIPLTFLAGVYGMNFDFMPELGWRWAYPAVWLIMLITAGVMVAYFKRKRWL